MPLPPGSVARTTAAACFPFTTPKARLSVNFTTISEADPGLAGPRYSPFLRVIGPGNQDEGIVIPSRSFDADPDTAPAETVLLKQKMKTNRIVIVKEDRALKYVKVFNKERYLTAFSPEYMALSSSFAHPDIVSDPTAPFLI